MASLEEDLYEAFVGATVGDQYGFGTDEGNCLEAIRGRSTNSKIDTTIEVVGLR